MSQVSDKSEKESYNLSEQEYIFFAFLRFLQCT